MKRIKNITELNSNFCKAMDELKKNGTTQKKAAELTGTTQQQWSYIYTGKRAVTYDYAVALNKLMPKYSVDYLMGKSSIPDADTPLKNLQELLIKDQKEKYSALRTKLIFIAKYLELDGFFDDVTGLCHDIDSLFDKMKDYYFYDLEKPDEKGFKMQPLLYFVSDAEGDTLIRAIILRLSYEFVGNKKTACSYVGEMTFPEIISFLLGIEGNISSAINAKKMELLVEEGRIRMEGKENGKPNPTEK